MSSNLAVNTKLLSIGSDGPKDIGLIHASANAARIVECVNACEGIENPAAIKDLVDVCRAYMALPVKIERGAEKAFLHETDAERRVLFQFGAALAALGVK